MRDPNAKHNHSTALHSGAPFRPLGEGRCPPSKVGLAPPAPEELSGSSKVLVRVTHIQKKTMLTSKFVACGKYL